MAPVLFRLGQALQARVPEAVLQQSAQASESSLRERSRTLKVPVIRQAPREFF